jgi:ABC-type molybdate transport system substrate-binding protein
VDQGSLRTRPEFWPVTVLSVALVAVLGGWGFAAYLERTRSEPACAERTTVRVAVAPSIARPARDVARAFAERERCLDVVVEARESADMLQTLARTAPGDTAAALPADAWLPESTLWLRRARAAGAFQVPADGVSVASTPVVIALDGRSATRLNGPVSWARLVADPQPWLPVKLPDPATSPLGFAALVGIQNLGRSDAGTAAIMRRFASQTISVDGEAPPAPTGPGPAEAAVFTTEQQVLHSVGRGRQVAVYPARAVPGPDYPYAVLADGPARTGATAFLRALLAAEGASAFKGNGLRSPRGATPGGIPPGAGIRTGTYPPVSLPAEPASVALLNAWGGVHLSARLLAVFDISGSMAAVVPGTQETRLSATVKAAQGGARLLLDTTELGIWAFSTDLDGDRDYREVAPVAPIGPRRAQMLAALGRMKVKPNGATGLYDTALAAYRDGTRNWTPGRINMVLILTDGADDDVSGISRAELLRQLRGLVDRKRPLPILFIGVGKEIDPGELQEIAKVTGGRVALTAQPSGIRQIFFSALSEFSCLPPRCRR